MPSYEDTQRGVDQCPLYENVVLEGPNPVRHHHSPSSDLWHQQPPYPLNAHVNHTPPVRLQVSLPPEWPSDCATLTNYRYDTLDGYTNQSEPSLLLDRHGRPLQPGGNGSIPLLQQQRVGQYVEAQNAVLASELYQSALATAPREADPNAEGGTTTYEEFIMGVAEDDVGYRRRERTCAKGFFVVCLIISAIAIIVFLVIAVLKSVHII
ncbi:uncharacterized protein LOC143286473 isoform X2 [Babylonia areolata]|uniref:uncharacterized protein LOC143286473 isoform X2 n=1 Tax=Babylonia areolata TaxID=304850 RepID=UPI003FD1C634